jgi:hypothetical protein
MHTTLTRACRFQSLQLISAHSSCRLLSKPIESGNEEMLVSEISLHSMQCGCAAQLQLAGREGRCGGGGEGGGEGGSQWEL